MADKKYASFTDDFRARIERERANPGARSADFKGEDEDQSKPKSESDSASVASSASSQDGGEVMGTLQKGIDQISFT